MSGKEHTCYVCSTKFYSAVYWYDNIHNDDGDRRIIRPFCGYVCANKYRDTTDVNDLPARPKPWPRGDEWQVIDNIDFIHYESD